jgi:DNA-binding transcriptional regulator YiaG
MTNEQIQLIAATRRTALTGDARRIRKDANLRVSELASHLGVTETTLNRWETSERVPNARDTLRWGLVLLELSRMSEDFDDLP